MNEWEARYKALLAGIRDRAIIDNAEAMVVAAMRLANSSPISFEQAFNAILQASGLLKPKPEIGHGVDLLNVWPTKDTK